MISVEGLTHTPEPLFPPEPDLCGHDLPRSGHQGEKTDSRVRNRTDLPVLDTTETTDSRVPNGTDLPVLDSGRKPIPGFEIEPGLSPVTKPGLGGGI